VHLGHDSVIPALCELACESHCRPLFGSQIERELPPRAELGFTQINPFCLRLPSLSLTVLLPTEFVGYRLTMAKKIKIRQHWHVGAPAVGVACPNNRLTLPSLLGCKDAVQTVAVEGARSLDDTQPRDASGWRSFCSSSFSNSGLPLRSLSLFSVRCRYHLQLQWRTRGEPALPSGHESASFLQTALARGRACCRSRLDAVWTVS